MSFAVYRSSAGSGKTYTLVREYLELVLSDPGNYSQILAITFTNKVANEMKERVLGNLKELSGPAELRSGRMNRDLLPELIRDTGLSEIVIAEKATRALELILHNYSDFAVSTIDSFFHRIIRTFAFDFGLPVNFNVELDSDELIETAVNLLLDRIGDDKDLTVLLVNFLESKMEEDRSWNIENILKDFARTLFDEESARYLGKLRSLSLTDFNRIASWCYGRIRQYETKISSIAEKALNLINEKGIPAGAFYQGTKGIFTYFEKLVHGNFDGLDSKYAEETINSDKWTSGKTTAEEKKSIEGIREDLKRWYTEIREERAEHEQAIILFRQLTGTIYPLAVLNELDRILLEFKRENNLVHISEFNRRINEIILDEPVPFIYERLGERFSHILIDEFQDTSVLQWTNLLPLVENALSTGTSSLVVGDAKQAIYRWRNGDATQFTALPKIRGSEGSSLLKERERLLASHFTSHPLNTNHRSGYEIVMFNNRFFSSLVSLLGTEGQKVYENLVQEPSPGKTGGYIHIEFSGAGISTVQYNETTLLQIGKIIEELERDEFRRKDIAVLCRSNKEASLISSYLLGNGIDVISAESLLITGSPEVVFLTGLIRLLYANPDILLQAELATYLFRKGMFSGILLHDLLKEIKKNKPTADAFFTFIRSAGIIHGDVGARQLLILPVFDLCEELIRLFSFQKHADPFLQFFLDAVYKFSRKISPDPTEFLEWWEDHKKELSVIVPAGMNAVHVMTIHKSKGLQFPAVILPFVHQRKKFSKPWLWVDLDGREPEGLLSAMLKPNKELQKTNYGELYDREDEKSLIDLVNLLYVAMTRPEERLYILSKVPGKSMTSAQSLPAFFVHFLREQGLWSDELLTYDFGHPAKHASSGTKTQFKTSGLESFISSAWQKKIVIRRRAPETWDMEDPQGLSRWGNLVHSVLSGILTEEDVDPSLDAALTSGIMVPEEKIRLRKKILEIIQHERIKPFFSKGITIKTESEILLPGGAVYRPDRVIINGDKATVIDYKTGRARESHRKQVKEYESSLLDMGYTEVKKFIIYLDPVTGVVEID